MVGSPITKRGRAGRPDVGWQNQISSSARDQIGQQPVAVKKLSEPLKTAGNARHIFKEIQLLKHLKHENVRWRESNIWTDRLDEEQIINLVDIFISPSEDMYVASTFQIQVLCVDLCSYLVTDLMQTDLQTLLKTKPIEGEFVQFFVYQIMVRRHVTVRGYLSLTGCLARPKIYSFGWCSSSWPKPGKHLGQWELRSQDMRFWAGTSPRTTDDGLRFHQILQGPWNHAYMEKIWRTCWHLEYRMHLRWNAAREATFSGAGPYRPVPCYHRSSWNTVWKCHSQDNRPKC